jgi:hypothetical protein
MKSTWYYALVVVAASAIHLPTPEAATAQEWCAYCATREGELPNGGGRAGAWKNCAVKEGMGFLECWRPNYDRCYTSSNSNGGGFDCGLSLRLDGRAARLASGTTGIDDHALLAARPVGDRVPEKAPALIRHSCSRGLIRRSYSTSEIEVIRAEHRFITVG